MHRIGELAVERQLAEIWNELKAGLRTRGHPFRTASLATVADAPDGSMRPELRTVVVRELDSDAWQLVFHTDRRSPKVSQLIAHPGVSLLFYDVTDRLQLRLRGEAQVHLDDELARNRWEQSPPQSRECYLSPIAPSTALTAGGNLPAPTDGGAEGGFGNFAAVSIDIESLEALFLDHRGHERREWIREAGELRRRELAP